MQGLCSGAAHLLLRRRRLRQRSASGRRTARWRGCGLGRALAGTPPHLQAPARQYRSAWPNTLYLLTDKCCGMQVA